MSDSDGNPRNRYRAGASPRRSRLRLIAFLSILLIPAIGRAQSETSPVNPDLWNRHLEIGPLAGLTTTWHPAPLRTAVPMNETVRLRVRVPRSQAVTWTGAREATRHQAWSIAEQRFVAPGFYTITVAYGDLQGEQIEERITLEAVDTGTRPVRVVSVHISAEPMVLDPENMNASTMRYFFQGSSIAALRELGPRHYRTSTNRWLTLEANVEPAAFAPIIEWRLDGRPQLHLGELVRLRSFTVREHTLEAGPPAASQQVRLDTYAVRIISHKERDRISDEVPVTFAAETDPPGHEDEITWLASTKYGSSAPVTGHGPGFTVRFENTLASAGRWLGVRADNDVASEDSRGTPEPEIPKITSQPGKVVISFQNGDPFFVELTAAPTPDCLTNACRAAVLTLREPEGEVAATLTMSQIGTDILAVFSTPPTTLGAGAGLLFGNCYPFPDPFPNPYPPQFPDPVSSPFPKPFPPLPFPCPCPTFPVPGGPCDPTPFPFHFVNLVAAENYSLTLLTDKAQELASFHGGVAELLQETLGADLADLQRLNLLNDAVLNRPAVAAEFEQAVIQSGLKAPIVMKAAEKSKLEKASDIATASCGFSVLFVKVASPVTCGVALLLKVACILWCS